MAARRIEQIGDCELHGFVPRAVIYAFRKNSVTYYVGSTINTIRQRLRRHIVSAQSGSEIPVHKWIRNVNAQFEVHCLEYVDADCREAAERKWIKRLRTDDLKNLTNGGLGLSGYKPTEDRNKTIAERLRKGAHFPCEVCGQQFWRKPRAIRLGQNRFCSREHYQEWQRGKPKRASR